MPTSKEKYHNAYITKDAYRGSWSNNERSIKQEKNPPAQPRTQRDQYGGNKQEQHACSTYGRIRPAQEIQIYNSNENQKKPEDETEKPVAFEILAYVRD